MKAHVNIFPTPATKFPTKESSQEIRKEILACKNSCKEGASKLRNFELQKYFLGMETPTRNQNFHFQNMVGLARPWRQILIKFLSTLAVGCNSIFKHQQNKLLFATKLSE
jgi:hypothetical protein